MNPQPLKPYRTLQVAVRTTTLTDANPLLGVILHFGEESTEYWVDAQPRPIGPLVHWANQTKGIGYDVSCQGGTRPYPAGCTCPHGQRRLQKSPCRHMAATKVLLERGELRSELPTPPAPVEKGSQS